MPVLSKHFIQPSYHNIGFAHSAAESARSLDWDGLVGLWLPTLGPSGLTLRDWSGYGNHGSLVSMVEATDWVLDGELGYVLNYDATDNNVKMGDNGPLPGLGDGSFTLSAWFKTSNTSKAFMQIVTRDNNTDQGAEGRRLLAISATDASSRTPEFVIFDGTNIPRATATLNYDDGNWHHIVGVRDVEADVLILYMDGNAEIISVEDSTTTSINTARHVFYISNTNDLDTFPGEFDGSIGPVRIYNRVLTPSEVLEQYFDPYGIVRQKRPLIVRIEDAISVPVVGQPFYILDGRYLPDFISIRQI